MKAQRIQAITDYVTAHGVVPLAELESEFHISISTLRRDIAALCEAGILNKMYGCVSKSFDNESFVPFHVRSNIHLEEKNRAAQVAAQFVNDNDFIFLDSGSTTCRMIDFLENRKNISIVTNNLDVIMRAVSYPNLQIYILPGVLNRANNSFTYLEHETLFNKFNITKVFMACTGFSLQRGISHADPSESFLKKDALALTKKRYLVLDSTKFDHVAPLRLCDIDLFPVICTNSMPAEKYLAYFKEHGIQLYCEV